MYLDKILSFIHFNSEFDLSKLKDNYKITQIKATLDKYKFSSYKQLYEEILRNDEIGKYLVTICLNHATQFYRAPELFERLTKNILPNLVNEKLSKNEVLNIWVAGCSTGDEAYSMAIEINENFARIWNKNKVNIVATDISENIILSAKKGEYIINNLITLNKNHVEKYFSHNYGRYRVIDKIKENVTFLKHDLIDDPNSNDTLNQLTFDLIICRNVLMYYKTNHKEEILLNLISKLEKKGYLVTGEFDDIHEKINNSMEISNISPFIFKNKK